MARGDLLALGYADDMGYDDDDGGGGGDGGGLGWGPADLLAAARQHGPAALRAAAQLVRHGGGGRPARRPPAFAGGQNIGSRVPALQQILALPPGGAGIRPEVAMRETLLGSAITTFTAGGATAATLTFTPFKRCKPTRIVAGQAVTGVPGQLVTATSVNVGDRNQLGGAAAIDVQSAWAGNVTFSNINWDVIDPAVPLIINLQLTAALAAMTAIVQSLTLYVTAHN